MANSTGVKLVIAVWGDAWGDQDNFTSIHGATITHKAMIVQTLGWLIVDNEEGVKIANERSMDEGGDVYRGITFIPRPMIRSVSQFNLSKPRQKKSEPA